MSNQTLALDAIKQRAEAATEGPWRWDEPTDDSFPQSEENLWTVNPGADGHPDCVVGSWGYDADGIIASPEDRAFIAHARTDVPALVAEVERLQGIVDRVQALRDEMGEGKAFTILAMGKEADYPISYFLEYLDTALEGQ